MEASVLSLKFFSETQTWCTVITDEIIQQAVKLLAEGGMAQRVILFGSYAKGTAGEDSDLDFLVVVPALVRRREEMVRLRALLRPLGIPVDVLVADESHFERWKDQPGTALFEAARDGRVMYDRAG